MGEWLSQYGELLPVTVMNNPETHWIFNCRAKKDIDPDRSSMDCGEDLPVINFVEGVDDPEIFKTDFDKCSFLYCGEKFKATVEDYGLQGLSFTQLK
ncbi:MAG: hypothetical protein C9356_18985 [Oleiphilus sp.]|nr:MAG: hypothetical protein C9356_18985 [Oleiphilus sp.]